MRLLCTIRPDMDTSLSPLQRDLIAMLDATRAAERDLFGEIEAGARERPAAIGEWSAKDVLSHLAEWRSIEARRIAARSAGRVLDDGDPPLDEPIDESNARLHDAHADWTWEAVASEADASIDALIAA